MKTKGIRILDEKNRIISVNLSDILNEIQNGNMFHWSILHINASGHLGEGKSIPDFSQKINKSEKGLPITWDELNELAKKLYEIVDILIIACKDEDLLIRYSDDQEMHETCDIVIEMVDSNFWEVFSQEKTITSRLASKFQNTQFLESNFEK